MIWLHIQSFFLMGGYAAYVWPAISVVLLVLGFNFWWSLRQQRKTILLLARRADE